MLTLARVRAALEKRYGAFKTPVLSDPFQLVIYEQVAYLAGDEKRGRAFALLEERVGISPKAVAAAPPRTLQEVARTGGGIAFELRAKRMAESARRVLDDWGGDLRGALSLPRERALRELAKFPMIGKPGAEKILLFTHIHPVLALDSNGLRVLTRLGYGKDDTRYEVAYRSVQKAVEKQLRRDFDWLISLHRLLRRHGQETCTRTKPDCETCPLRRSCPSASIRTDRKKKLGS